MENLYFCRTAFKATWATAETCLGSSFPAVFCNQCPLFYRTVSMDQTWVGRWTVWAATIPSQVCLSAQAVRAAVWAACRKSWMRAALNWSWCITTRAQLIPLPLLCTRRYVLWCSPQLPAVSATAHIGSGCLRPNTAMCGRPLVHPLTSPQGG